MGHKRILVADQNTHFLEKTAEILSTVEIEMIPVENGNRVMTLCHHEKPEAALLNIDLPGTSGAELCLQLKSHQDPSLPVVLMFPEESPENKTVAARGLADNFLVRPLKRSELLFTIRSLARLRELYLKATPRLMLSPTLDVRHPGMVSLEVLHTFLALEIRRVERYGFPMGLLTALIDPLPESCGEWSKTLDSQLGPALAQAIRSCLRDIDLSAVISSHEMCILMPHTDANGVQIAAERICQAIAAQSYHFGRVHIRPTVSVGGTCLHGSGADPQTIMELVKANRERATTSGGNCAFVR